MTDFLGPFTIGKDSDNEWYTLHLYYDSDGTNLKKILNYPAYALIHFQEGIGYINKNNSNILISSPGIYCSNEKEIAQLFIGSSLKYEVVYFNPCVINEKFNFEMLTTEFANNNQDGWYLRPFIERNTAYTGIIEIDHTVSKRISTLLADIGNVLEEIGKHWPCRSRAFFFELMLLIGNVYDKSKTDKSMIVKSTIDDINGLLEYLHSNYQNKITIDSLTRAFNINRTTLNNKFKEATGCSVIEYLNYIRIQVACSMLRNTYLPIYEIHERVGFKDDANFVRMFKKHIKCSPSDYRKENCLL